MALGPIVGPAHFPTWLPTFLTAYLGGQRPMSWFGLFPWAAWPLVGVALGHTWSRASTDPRTQAKAFILSGVGGAVLIGIVSLIRAINPYIIHYPSDLVQQMGPGSFFYKLGLIGLSATVAWAAVRAWGTRFSVMRQFGHTSLLVYWIHVDLCYGLIARRLHLMGELGMWGATLGLIVMVALMLGVSLAKTTWWEPWRRRRNELAAARSAR